MILAFLIRLVTILLAISFIVTSCGPQPADPHCKQTQKAFIDLFNDSKFHQIRTLFQNDSRSAAQFRKMVSDLDYIKSMVGNIKMMEVTETQGNMVKYLSTHRETTMEISFLYNGKCQLTSLLIKNHYPDDLPVLERNTTSMRLPFEGEWYVSWGGSTLEQNYHNAHRNMKGAYDFVIRDGSGKSYRTDGKKNEDYYAFSQPVVAPCTAEVVKVVRGVRDNQWPRINKQQAFGNVVVLKTSGEEYLLFAHLKEGSIVVKKGQRVNPGEKLALCGNSGYSTEPHLHFNLQNVADLLHPTGAFCYFNDIMVSGKLKQDYMPVRGEFIRNH